MPKTPAFIHLVRTPQHDESDGILFFAHGFNNHSAHTSEEAARAAATEAAAQLLHAAAHDEEPTRELSKYHNPEEPFYAPINDNKEDNQANLAKLGSIIDITGIINDNPDTYCQPFENLTIEQARQLVTAFPYPYNNIDIQTLEVGHTPKAGGYL